LIATRRPINKPSTRSVSNNVFVILKMPKEKIGSAANETIGIILKGI
jgi:hypothetical protein